MISAFRGGLVAAALLLAGCPTRFDPPRLGITVGAATSGGETSYTHAASGVSFRMPIAVERGERIAEGSRYERISLASPERAPLYRVVILRPIDGSRVVAQDAVDELANGLIEQQSVDRDVCRTVDGHPARVLAIARANDRGDEGFFQVVSDGHVVVLMEMVAPAVTDADLDTVPVSFFETLVIASPVSSSSLPETAAPLTDSAP